MNSEAVFTDQRRRLRAATIELAAEVGVGRVTVRGLSQRAGVSTRTFYRQFTNVADCVGFASEAVLCDAVRGMEEARVTSQGREEAVHAAIASLLSYLADNPEAASVALLEVFDAGSGALARVQTASRTLEEILAILLATPAGSILVPRRLLSGMVAGVLRIAREAFIAGRADELPAAAPDLSSWLLSLASGPGGDLQRFARAKLGVSSRREADPLPDGRGYRDGGLAGDDRERIVRAAVRLAAADRFANLTITRIRRAAEVSRRSFDAQFATVSECFLASLEWLAGATATRARVWAASEGDRDRRTPRILAALAAQAARNDALADLVLVRILEPGRDGLLCREGMVGGAATAMRSELTPGTFGGGVALNASVAAAWEIAATEVAAGRSSRLPGLSPVLAGVILVPHRSGLKRPRS